MIFLVVEQKILIPGEVSLTIFNRTRVFPFPLMHCLLSRVYEKNEIIAHKKTRNLNLVKIFNKTEKEVFDLINVLFTLCLCSAVLCFVLKLQSLQWIFSWGC